MKREPRIILFDLETIPDMREAMKVWPQLSNYPGLTLRASITSIICCGWKVFGEKKTRCLNAWDYPNWKKDINDDSEIVKDIYEVLDSADAVVTHNGKAFDWKFCQTRFIKHGLKPLGKTTHIDTKELAKRNLFSFNNRLGTLGDWIANDKKLDHSGWDLWVKVSKREKKAQQLMTKYCKQDVNLLEKVFKKLMPFAGNLPNQNFYDVGEKRVCPACGGTRLFSKGYHMTKTNQYKRYRCNDCGANARTNLKDQALRTI